MMNKNIDHKKSSNSWLTRKCFLEKKMEAVGIFEAT